MRRASGFAAAAPRRGAFRVIGVSINGSEFSNAEVAAEREKVRNELGLPVCDPIRHGPDELVEAVLDLKRELDK